MSRVTIYNLDVLRSLFGTSLLFHVQSVVPTSLLLPDLHTSFSRGRSGGLVFPSLSEFSTVYCDTHIKGFGIVNEAEIDVFLELSCFFDDPADVGNLISGSSAFSKTSLNIWKFTVHVLLKPGFRGMQIKTLMRYHLTLVRMAIIKKSTNNKFWRGYWEKRIVLHCRWEHKLV